MLLILGVLPIGYAEIYYHAVAMYVLEEGYKKHLEKGLFLMLFSHFNKMATGL